MEQRKRDKERGRETSKEEFLKWEQDYTQMWDRMLDNVHSVNMDMDSEAKTEEPIFFSDDDKRIPETIEVQAGQYYMERNQELRDAIMASDSETKEKDLRTLGSFLRLVIEHVSFRYATPEETRFKYTDGEQGFENDRSRAHNEVIKCLNTLNDLAKKYGTTRFTPRNFWTSETKGQTKDIARRMKYDRKVVIEYYTLAFGKGLDEEVKRRRAEEARYY